MPAMSFERIRQLRPYPNFDLSDLPETEHDEAGSICVNIGRLHHRAAAFWAARMLFLNCAERQLFDPANGGVYHEWQLCAARDAVMSVYHFGRILEGIDKSLGACLSLRGKIDIGAKKAAKKQFKRRFPSFISLRHALAHSAERSKTAKDFRRHGLNSRRVVQINPAVTIRLSADGDVVLFDDNIWGTTFSSHWDGQVVQCEINDQSGAWLDEAIDAYWAAFDAIIDHSPKIPPIIEQQYCDGAPDPT